MDLITIATFGTPLEAEVVRDALAHAGIEAYLEGSATVGMAWYLSNAVGGVRLLVADQDVARAQVVLDDFDRRRTEGLPEAADAGDELSDEDIEENDADGTFDAAPDRTAADLTAQRAWRAAVLGLFLCPPVLLFYSGWLLVKLSLDETPLSDWGRRRFHAALAVDLAGTAVVAWFVSTLV